MAKPLYLSAEQSKLLEAFRTEICERAKDVDPDEEFQWYDLSVGFFIAKGATPEMACELATIARYKLGYWQTA